MTTHFHLAFPVNDLETTKTFYHQGLGCTLGRQTPIALILNLHNHQLVAHLTPDPLPPQTGIYPRHFGLIFTTATDWEALLDRAQAHHLPFYQAPKHRFPDQLTEHRTFFLQDPSHNLLEFKYYSHPEAIFGAQDVRAIGDAFI